MYIQKVIHVHIQSQQKEWNLVVLTIVSSLDYEDRRILSYLCRNGPSL